MFTMASEIALTYVGAVIGSRPCRRPVIGRKITETVADWTRLLAHESYWRRR